MKKYLSIEIGIYFIVIAIFVAFIVLLGVVGRLSSETSEPSSSQVPTVFEYPTDQSLDMLRYEVGDYTEIEELFIMELTDKGLGSYRMYDASELTLSILKHRKGTTVIERCIGLVSDAQTGDAVLLNPPDDCGYYLSYGSCDQEVRDGTILVSYMVYNPDTDYFDDIIERYDFVICRDYEERD